MSTTVKTKNLSDLEMWNQAIREAEAMLSRVEDKAERLRVNIRSLRELRDAGEPWQSANVLTRQEARE